MITSGDRSPIWCHHDVANTYSRCRPELNGTRHRFKCEIRLKSYEHFRPAKSIAPGKRGFAVRSCPRFGNKMKLLQACFDVPELPVISRVPCRATRLRRSGGRQIRPARALRPLDTRGPGHCQGRVRGRGRDRGRQQHTRHYGGRIPFEK